MMLRREMVKSVNANKKLESMQKDLEENIMSAHERKHRFLAAKKAKAAGHQVLDRTSVAVCIVDKAPIPESLETPSRRSNYIKYNITKGMTKWGTLQLLLPYKYLPHTWGQFFNLILLRDVAFWVLFNFSLQLSHRM
jgi:hypothetical protein